MQKHFFLSIIFSCSSFYFADAQSNYKVLNQIKLQGDGGWDYLAVDDINQHIFVSHGNQVNVVDATTQKEIAIIPETKGVHGIAIANNLNKGYISNGKDSSVTIFDLKTFTITNKIYVTGKNPDAILFDGFSQRLFTFNGKGKNATVIDVITEKVIGTIDLSGKPEFAVSNNVGKIYVNIENTNEIVVIDAQLMTIDKRFSIEPGDEPSGLAIDEANNRLFSVCGNKKLIIINANTGKLISWLPIGDGADAVIFDDVTKNIIVSNGEGTITVAHEEDINTFKIMATIPTEVGAKTLAFNKANHHIYLPKATIDTSEGADKKHRKIVPNSFLLLEMATE